MSLLSERLYVSSLVSVNLIVGALLYLLGSPAFAGMLCVLALVVAGSVFLPVTPQQSTAEFATD
jgi:hypothetical protein